MPQTHNENVSELDSPATCSETSPLISLISVQLFLMYVFTFKTKHSRFYITDNGGETSGFMVDNSAWS